MNRVLLLLALAGCPKSTPDPAPDATSAEAPATDLAVGDWKGSLVLPGAELRLALHVTLGEDGLAATLDSPDQGAFGIPASRVSIEGRELLVDVASLRATYQATVDEQSMSGTFQQGPAKLPLTLTRGSFDKPARPQEPTGPLPYTEEAVSVPLEGHALAGTLTLPPGDEAVPAVVLVSGSGPQDRDEALLGHRPFYVLADRLTRAGIAVLRYDDRGVGESTGDFAAATTSDFATDARAALTWLDAHPRTSRVGVLGHSEGGMVAPMVVDAEPDFLVLFAAPAVPIVELMLRQQEDVALSMGVPDSQARARRDERRRMLELIATSDDPASLEELRTLMTSDPSAAGVSEEELAAALASTTTPWWREFAAFDPTPNLQAIRVPTLAVWGSLDTQVAAEPNHAAMVEAVPAEFLDARTYPGLNHLFQPATTGSVQEYATIETTMSEEVMADVAAFIRPPG